MLRADNITCCLTLTLVLLIAALSFQTTRLFAAAAPAASGAAANLADAAATMDAYRVLRRWVSEFSTPALDDAACRIDPAGSRAVCVILRRSGRILGSGTDNAGDGLMLRRAVGRALGEVLADPVVANLPADLKATVGRALVIELEAAGAMEPLVGQTFSEVSSQVEPGLDGIAMRRGQAWSLRFPSQLLAAGKADEVDQLFPGLALELGLPVESLAKLGRTDNVGVYRFRTVHLAQSGPQEQPWRTYRGDVLVTDSQVTQHSIAALADGIASHLLASRWPDPHVEVTGPEAEPGAEPIPEAGPGPNPGAGANPGVGPFPGAGAGAKAREPLGVMGTYRPMADTYDGPNAGPLEQALVSWSLSEYSIAPGVDTAIAERAAALAAEILRDLAAVRPGEADPLADADACAAIIHAVAALPDSRAEKTVGDPAIAGLRDQAARRVVGFDAGVEGDGRGNAVAPPTPHRLALRAGAMARLLRRWPGMTDAAKVRDAIDAAWAAAAEQQYVTLLPFIGWAEIDCADATGTPIAGAARLAQLREVLHASQISAGTEDAAEDLRGGFALRTEASKGRIQATSQSARAMSWLATALGEPRLTDPQRSLSDLARLLRAMRFLQQLSLRSELTWSVRNPQRALGGLRNAPWDSDMPAAAQAMGLVAAARTLVSLDQLGKRTGNP